MLIRQIGPPKTGFPGPPQDPSRPCRLGIQLRAASVCARRTCARGRKVPDQETIERPTNGFIGVYKLGCPTRGDTLRCPNWVRGWLTLTVHSLKTYCFQPRTEETDAARLISTRSSMIPNRKPSINPTT